MSTLKWEYHFINDPSDKLKCSVCLKVPKGRPMQHGDDRGCGKLFCKECIMKLGSKPCPMCEQELPKYFEDVRSFSDISNLTVRCDGVDRGCEWTGIVGTLEDHLNECEHAMVRCSKKCKVDGNDFYLLREDLEKHLATECRNRPHKCEYCGEEGTYASIVENHGQHCLKAVIPCPSSDCKLKIKRERAETHIAKECEHALVACKYRKIGCTHSVKRMAIKAHEEDDKHHFPLSLQKIVQLEDSLKEQSDWIKELETTMEVYITVPEFTKKINASEHFRSDSFFTNPSGYHMRLHVFCNGIKYTGRHISVFTKVHRLPHKPPMGLFRGCITIILLNQVSDENNYEQSKNYINNKCARPEGGLWGFDYFISHHELDYDPHENTQYLRDDELRFKVIVQERID